MRSCKRCDVSPVGGPRSRYCEPCKLLNNREHRAAWKVRNPEKVCAATAIWQKANREYLLVLNRASSKARKQADPRKEMLNGARMRAKRDGLAFTISLADVTIPATCPYLGIILCPGHGRIAENAPTIDRIDNGVGYVPGNVEVISYRANRMKSNSSPQEALLMAEGFIRRFRT